MTTGLVDALRSLGFGGLLGGGLLGLAYCLLQRHFPPTVTLADAISLGGVLGAGLHQFIERYVVNGVLQPVGAFVAYYVRLAQILGLVRAGVLLPDEGHQLVAEITRRYILGEPVGRERPLPESPVVTMPASLFIPPTATAADAPRTVIRAGQQPAGEAPRE